MKFTLRLIAVLFIFSVNAAAQNPGDSVFAGTQIHSININFSQPNYWDSLVYYYGQGNGQYMMAEVIINGVSLDSCGVRLKGNSSYSHPNNKKSFKISFDEYRGNQTWDNMKSVHLNNAYGDPTFMREKMFLDFCRDAGITGPRANYVNLSINTVLFAFYSLVENVDKKFLSTRFGDNSGDLFKSVDGFEGNQLISDFRWYTSVPDSYYTRYELKTDGSTTAYPQLISLLDTLNNGSDLLNGLPQKINLSSLYKGIAADIIFANLDSYINSGRNFYFYFYPATGKLEWIVWDAGLCFGGYGGGVSNFENLNVAYLVSIAQRPLLGKIFSTPALKTQYLNLLCILRQNLFSSARLFPKIDNIYNMIRSYVYADPRKQYTNNQFEINILADLPTGGVGGSNRIPGLKSFITARESNIKTQLVNLGINCNTAINPGDVVINEFAAMNDSILDPAGEAEDWIELYNNTSNVIDLSGMYLSDNYSQPAKWQFPVNTTIDAGGYLIVWADEDSGQTGLHADFKLSSTNGEEIIFSASGLTLLDSISFGPQMLNLTMARIPNGTGSFVKGVPTFNSNNSGTTSIDTDVKNYPALFELGQNYPNPFNPVTTISYSIPPPDVNGADVTLVQLKVYNILGSELATLVNENKTAGTYNLSFNSQKYSLTSGVYFYRLTAGKFTSTKRMILLK